jgi:hypothetical protein
MEVSSKGRMMGERGNVERTLIGRVIGKRLPAKTKYRWEDIIKYILRK